MYYRSLFPSSMFADLDRLQREVQQVFGHGPSIRGLARGFPALNVGGTPQSVEMYAFAPGLDPASLDVQIEKGTLTLAGERKAADVPEKATVHINERFAGRFRRVVSLPDGIDPASVAAKYRDGVLHVRILSRELDPAKTQARFEQGVLSLRIPKAEHAQPRRIEVQVA